MPSITRGRLAVAWLQKPFTAKAKAETVTIHSAGGRSWKVWEAHDDALLMKLYATTPTSDLAKVMGRNVRSVWARAERLGIVKDKGRVA